MTTNRNTLDTKIPWTGTFRRVKGYFFGLFQSVVLQKYLGHIWTSRNCQKYLGQARSEEPASIHSICLDLRCF
jgi:hypothetical protein